MTAFYRSDLEEARTRLSEGLLRLWEQADLVDRLFKDDKSTEAAKDLLRTMQETIDEMQSHIDFLVKTTEGP